MNFFRLGAFLLAGVFFFSCSEEKEKPSAANARKTGTLTVDGFLVEIRSVSDKIEIPGSLLPAEETQMRPEVSGRITQLNIREGADVNKGALLVKLFDEDLQAQLKKLEVQLEIAAKTEERQRELLAINGISQQDYDLGTLQVKNLHADIQSVKIAIAKTEIRAPYAGKIGLRNVSLGAYVSPNEIITTLRQVETLKLEFAIPEKYAKEIARGAVINFRVDGGRDNHKAIVLATESGVDQATRTLRVRALVKEKHPELVPGVFAKVSLQLGVNANALMIPTQAVIPQARGKQVVIFRKDSAQFVEVETGVRDSVFVQVLNGVKAGDTIITTGLMAIRPNAKIKIGKLNRNERVKE
jgi:membrane fusion protein, multidrug efflux system